jgi:hypothetical protein
MTEHVETDSDRAVARVTAFLDARAARFPDMKNDRGAPIAVDRNAGRLTELSAVDLREVVRLAGITLERSTDGVIRDHWYRDSVSVGVTGCAYVRGDDGVACGRPRHCHADAFAGTVIVPVNLARGGAVFTVVPRVEPAPVDEPDTVVTHPTPEPFRVADLPRGEKAFIVFEGHPRTFYLDDKPNREDYEEARAVATKLTAKTKRDHTIIVVPKDSLRAGLVARYHGVVMTSLRDVEKEESERE